MTEKQILQQDFNSLTVEIAELEAEYLRLRQKPKWLFWLFFENKHDNLNQLKFRLYFMRISLDKARLKLLQHNGNHSSGEVSSQSA